MKKGTEIQPKIKKNLWKWPKNRLLDLKNGFLSGSERGPRPAVASKNMQKRFFGQKNPFWIFSRATGGLIPRRIQTRFLSAAKNPFFLIFQSEKFSVFRTVKRGFHFRPPQDPRPLPSGDPGQTARHYANKKFVPSQNSSYPSYFWQKRRFASFLERTCTSGFTLVPLTEKFICIGFARRGKRFKLKSPKPSASWVAKC